MHFLKLPGSRRSLACAAALASVHAAPLDAQLPSASARALGMGDNYTAAARGFDAVAWNPANLGLTTNPPRSFALLPFRGIVGLDPVSLEEITGSGFLDQARKLEFLGEIQAEGSERGTGGGDLTYLALSIGRVGFQVSSSGRGRFSLSPLAAELILFGNAGRTGEAQDYDLQNSDFTAAATSTAALSYAQPLSLPGRGRLSIGATAKYTVGHALATGRDAGTQVTADPLAVSVDFPIIHTDTTFRFDNGSGIGLDLGAAYQAGPLTVSAAVQNVFNTFAWDDGRLLYRRGRAFFDDDSGSTDFTARSLDQAPANVPGLQELRAYVQDLRYAPVLVAGAAFRTSPRLLLSADVRHAFDDDLRLGPQTHAGAGVEFAPVPVLPLRAGAAVVSGGYTLGVGAGLRLGRVNLSGAYGRRENDELGTDSQFMFTLSFGREMAQQQ